MDFFAYICTVNPAIQLTHAYYFKSVNFLDVLITSLIMEAFLRIYIKANRHTSITSFELLKS